MASERPTATRFRGAVHRTAAPNKKTRDLLKRLKGQTKPYALRGRGRLRRRNHGSLAASSFRIPSRGSPSRLAIFSTFSINRFIEEAHIFS